MNRGVQEEGMACIFLENCGFTVIDRNYRTRYGEVDIIAKKGDTLVFAEVKARSYGSFGRPAEHVTQKKTSKDLPGCRDISFANGKY